MFISMVESSQSQSTRTALLWEQRFNVAFSRARARMYMFRSVDEDELKPDDLKARAIRHFKSPMESAVPEVDDLIELCESGFEREVFRRLRKGGYRVTPQVSVAAYSIDMVVEGDQDRRLAVELDGDQHHMPEVWADDLFRQRTLERMGWRFWRCWGSSFYLDPDACMDDLIRSLDALGIKPLGGETQRNVYTEHRVIGEPEIKIPDVVPEAKEQREPTWAAATTPMLTPPVERKKTQRELPAADMISTPPIATEEPTPTAPAMELDAEYEADTVEGGDRILIAYNDEPGHQLTIRISDTEHDPKLRIIHTSHPLAQALLGKAVDEEVEISAGGGIRIVTIVRIEKKTPLEPATAEPDSTNGLTGYGQGVAHDKDEIDSNEAEIDGSGEESSRRKEDTKSTTNGKEDTPTFSTVRSDRSEERSYEQPQDDGQPQQQEVALEDGKGKGTEVPPPSDDVEWVNKIGASKLRRLHRWAKEKAVFQKADISSIYWLADDIDRKKRISPGIARKVRRLYERAISMGFSI